jgi:acyl-coenzyme A thioesterase PaaI-like protein
MSKKTHDKANPELVGTPLKIVDGVEAEVELRATPDMAVDGRGLVHGGFTFGLADYAAMLSVNHPNVVLGKSVSRFIAPVKVGDLMKAKAVVESQDGRRREVKVEVTIEEKIVYTGTLNCYILEKHVLET